MTWKAIAVEASSSRRRGEAEARINGMGVDNTDFAMERMDAGSMIPCDLEPIGFHRLVRANTGFSPGNGNLLLCARDLSNVR